MKHIFACNLFAAIAAVGMVIPLSARAQNVMTIDATAPGTAPQPVAAALGSSRNPRGETIGVNSEYLTMNGKPWLPVMGEFHFSRYPEAEWEPEILKMKAAGVGIVSTYVIWIHHEQTEGRFEWSGQRDLRHFVELCAKHGLLVYPRIGPWVHAETRNGGLPDWVLHNSATRENDPVYLKEVHAFYAQIAQQLRGLLWKDGGPVIGIQIENEYRENGPGKGSEHIRTLKAMAREVGMDVPLYTVTGWDGVTIPLDQVLPVFGGYSDAPWDGSNKEMPANEVYAFRFANRSAGGMGALGAKGQNSAQTYRGTPFLTAEVGGGIEDTYFRRPVVAADDIAAVEPVLLGSGVNLLGYYMFHGGRNPDGGAITLQESQRTGYPTDVPVKSYDFQAPLGEFGQERESLRKLKLVHYFLEDFGSLLAPMEVHAPQRVPSAPDDFSVPRVAARTAGDSGFVFFNNYVRGYTMPARPGFQVQLKLPSGQVRIPAQPMDLAAGAYGIWPVNLALPGATLQYSTAQLFKKVSRGEDTYFFFFAIEGVPSQFALDAKAKVENIAGPAKLTQNAEGIRIQAEGSSSEVDVKLTGGVHLVLLSKSRAEDIWRGDHASVLFSTKAAAYSDGKLWTLESEGNRQISFVLFGATASTPDDVTLHAEPVRGMFHPYQAVLPAVDVEPRVTKVQAAGVRSPWQFGPKLAWRQESIPMAPDAADFDHAAAWRVEVPAFSPKPYLSDVFLKIEYQGDVARLSQDHQLVDDNFWNGEPWFVGLKETIADWQSKGTGFDLRVLPMPEKHLMYLEEAGKLHFGADGLAGGLEGVHLIPNYQMRLDVQPVP